MKKHKTIALCEFTFLQRRVLIELLKPEWNWRTEKTILKAIEDERYRITNWIANDVATLLDRQEKPSSALKQLLEMGMIEVQVASTHNGKCIKSTTYYKINDRWKRGC